ncbi:MAG TPA: FAD-dependent oxidoreductase, partial [Methanocella sp.]|nr:FAD-dependent oxidoreductase [Methanocella sp.]
MSGLTVNVMETPYKANHGVPGKDQSFWVESAPDTDHPPLKGDVSVDVAVLGGGIAGLTTALLLKKGGLKVAVIEAGRIVKGVTGYTTAHISSSSYAAYYRELQDRFGEEKARTCAASCQASIDLIERLVKEYGIDCDFRRNSEYLYAVSEADARMLKAELEVESRLGLPVSFMDRAPLPFEHYGAIRYEGQAQFHPRKYLLGLAKAIPGDGSHIFEMTRALGVEDGEPATVQTERGEITAGDVVVATHFPILNTGLLFARMKPVRSYVLGIRAGDSLDDNMYYSSEDPCHYIRSQPTPEGPLLIVGGEDHPVGQVEHTEERYRNLEKFCKGHFQVKSIDYSWSTQDNYTSDGVPFIGKYRELGHVYVATGFKGTGMTYGTVAATLLSGLILEGSSPYQALYDPGRPGPDAGGARLIRGSPKAAETSAGERSRPPKRAPAMEAGEAAYVEIDGKKAAAYMDESGKLHVVSPACTHMGCLVQWNGGEKTWDCPCHGSRYTYDGKVIHSPTVRDLAGEKSK